MLSRRAAAAANRRARGAAATATRSQGEPTQPSASAAYNRAVEAVQEMVPSPQAQETSQDA